MRSAGPSGYTAGMPHFLTTTIATSAPARWLGTTADDVAMVAGSTVAIFTVVIVLTRLAGLRSFSQMSAFDFATTVAVGSLMASTASSPSTTLANGVVALVVLYAAQVLIAHARMRWGASAVDNTPLLLMYEGEVLHDNLSAARLAERDLWAKLRINGVSDPGAVLAVVFETTADVSVIQGEGPLDSRLLEHVRGAPAGAGGSAR